MKLSDDARKAIYDWRWGPYIHDPIERQNRDDVVIKKVMDTFDQLEAEIKELKEWLGEDKLAEMSVAQHARAQSDPTD